MKYIYILIIAVITTSANAMDSVDNRVNRLVPSHTKVQYAGSMGIISASSGWSYGKKEQWESDIFIGFLSDKVSDNSTFVFTIKESYIPFRKSYKNGLIFEPLNTGLFITRSFDKNLWVKPPEKYPDSYYGMSVNLRFNIFIGQSLGVKIPSKNSDRVRVASFFYELNSNDLYIVSAWDNSNISIFDIVKLSLGVKFRFRDYQ